MAKAKSSPDKSTSPQRDTPARSAPLAAAEEAAARGNIRTARSLLVEASRTGLEADQAAARERLKGLSLDPRALLASGIVLGVIACAAWATLLRGP